MAREHRADDRTIHPGRVLSDYSLSAIDHGPWPGRLALGPLPASDGDLAAIVAWGPAMILGLTEPAELERLQLSDLPARVSASRLQWCNAPIADFAAPDARFERNWPALRDEIVSLLDAGRRILVHCRAGKGRSGTVAAALLVGGGMMPDEAIQAVRRARPGAIETAGQETWVRALAAPGR